MRGFFFKTILGALAAAFHPWHVAAQRISSVSAGIAALEYRIDAGLGTERYRGLGAAAAVEVEAGSSLYLSLDVATGRLPAEEAADLDRELGQVGLDARVPVTSWLAAHGGWAMRTYSASIARSREHMLRVGGEARIHFLDGGIRSVLRLTYLPMVWQGDLGAPSLAFAASASLEYTVGPVRASLAYSLERQDYSDETREEQLSGLWFGFVLPLIKAP